MRAILPIVPGPVSLDEGAGAGGANLRRTARGGGVVAAGVVYCLAVETAHKTLAWRCCVTLPYCLYCLRSHA